MLDAFFSDEFAALFWSMALFEFAIYICYFLSCFFARGEKTWVETTIVSTVCLSLAVWMLWSIAYDSPIPNEDRAAILTPDNIFLFCFIHLVAATAIGVRIGARLKREDARTAHLEKIEKAIKLAGEGAPYELQGLVAGAEDEHRKFLEKYYQFLHELNKGEGPCPHCGKLILTDFRTCPFCNQALPGLTKPS